MDKTSGAELSPISLLVNSRTGHIICKRCNKDSGYGSIKGLRDMYTDGFGTPYCDPCADVLEEMGYDQNE